MSRMRRFFVLALMTASAACVSAAAQSETQTLSLRVSGRTPVEGARQGTLGLIGPLRCDTSRHVYLRGYQAQGTMQAPVVKISPDGKVEATFPIAEVPGFEQAEAWDFALGLRGEVYLLTMRRPGRAEIVKFDSDGRHSDTLQLEERFEPLQLAVFPSGELLVTGRKVAAAPEDPGEPFTGIFDRGGRLLRMVELPDDITAPPPPPTEEEEEDTERREAAAGRLEEYNRAISLTLAEPAEDGNIYVMRRQAEPVVFVVSASGEVVRRIVVPSPGEGFRSLGFKVAGGRLLVQFSREGQNAERIFSVIDAYEGTPIVDYTAGYAVGTALACYSPNGLTFIGVWENQLTLHRAVPH